VGCLGKVAGAHLGQYYIRTGRKMFDLNQ
jgi:hypothetical protein